MSHNPSFDLKQVSALFNGCISTARNRPVEHLDATAKAWLQEACSTVMKILEKRYWELADSVKSQDPLKLPNYVVDPTSPLITYLEHSKVLEAYAPVIERNLSALLKECGFHASVTTLHAHRDAIVMYTIQIFFPARIEENSESHATEESAVAHANAALERFSDSLAGMRVPLQENAFQVALRNFPSPSDSDSKGSV